MGRDKRAAFCGLSDDLGSVQEGKVASMVLLRADPLADIANASQIEAVFLAGRHFDRAALDAEHSRARCGPTPAAWCSSRS